jgi:molecular chaperone DnaK (HSP70)
MRKRNLAPTQNTKVVLRIPTTFCDIVKLTNGRQIKECIALSKYKNQIVLVSDKMRIENDVLKSFFEVPLRSISDNMKAILANRQFSDCMTILMVGGFLESPILQEYIQRQFPHKNIIIPEEAGLAVLKGSVILGHTIFKSDAKK